VNSCYKNVSLTTAHDGRAGDSTWAETRHATSASAVKLRDTSRMPTGFDTNILQMATVLVFA
jgi:hypothetical protein